MSGPRGYSPRYSTIFLVNDLQRALAPVGGKVRLLPPSRSVGSRRVQITIGTEVRRATLQEARQIVADLTD